MAHLLSLGHPTATIAGETEGGRPRGHGLRVGPSTIGRVAGTVARLLPTGRLRLMAAVVFLTPFSGSISELHARADLRWATAVPLGLLAGAAFWVAAAGVWSAVSRQRQVPQP